MHTLVLTDVTSGWTECMALPVREQTLIVEAINGLRSRLPFPLLGLDTDNDTAFLNDSLLSYCLRAEHCLHAEPSLPEERSSMGRAEERSDRPQVGWLRPSGGPDGHRSFASSL